MTPRPLSRPDWLDDRGRARERRALLERVVLAVLGALVGLALVLLWGRGADDSAPPPAPTVTVTETTTAPPITEEDAP